LARELVGGESSRRKAPHHRRKRFAPTAPGISRAIRRQRSPRRGWRATGQMPRPCRRPLDGTCT
jgi:hypothetical protein